MLSVRVLGELVLERDGVAFDLPARRARSLLALLALDRRLHARTDLAARFWPDVLDESARTSLRSALAALRRALGPDGDQYLIATREHVGLRGDIRTDVEMFTELAAAGRLQEAIDLYRGDLLTGFDEDWVHSVRDEWRERAAGILEQLAAAAAASANWPAAIASTRRIVALDPLAEEGQRALISRLAQAGDRPAALAAYARYADRLRTELRIAPSAATRAVVEELRRTDEDQDVAPIVRSLPPPPPQPTAPPTASAAGTVTLLFTDLVGSTELLGILGEDGAEQLRRDHFGLLRDVAVSHAGQEVKSLGDGLMVAFTSSTDAAACAIGIQQAVARHNRRTGSEHMRVRVGLNVGEPIREADDFFGTPVVVAKRLCDYADGGQILASELVRLLIGGRGDFTFRPVGELALKGLTQPTAACEIAWEPADTQRLALPRALERGGGTLVGRAAELSALDEAWRRVCTGRLGVVMAAGEPGIGKTRLVTEFCRRAQAEGASVLFGRCHEETLSPHEAFIEALRAYVAACPVDELRFQIGTRRRVLARLVPELDGGDTDVLPAAEQPDIDAGDRFALFDAVGTLLREAASTHPTILVLDDLQWADEASLLLVRHVARAASDVPLLIVGTYRETELRDGDALSAALAELRRSRVLETLPISGLDGDDVAALIRGLGAELGDERTVAVARRTEGNPFYVEELVRHLDAGGELSVPESVKDLVRRRLQGLGEPATRAIRAAAVLGREFDLALLERMEGDDSRDLLEAVDEALSSSVLTEVPGPGARLTFSHALIRETVYEQLSAARRARLHQRAGAALEQLHALRLDDHAEQLAHHFVQAGDDERSFEYQLRAARAAARVYAQEAAIVHQGAALETAGRLALTPEGDERVRRALLERGRLRHSQGDHDASLADYGRCLAAARTAGDRRMQAEALDHLAFAEKPFDVERSAAHHEEALAIADDLADTQLQIGILGRMSLSRANNLDLAGAMEAGERALALAETTGGGEDDRKIAIDALKLAALQLGDLDRLGALTAELEEVERRQGDLWYLQWTLLESAFIPIAHAQWERADARLREALAINQQVGDVFGGPAIHDAVCWLERSRGDYARALAEGRMAVGLSDGDGPSPFGAWTRATLGWALLDARAVDQAVAVLEQGLADVSTQNDRFRLSGHLAWAHALAGDDARADRATGIAEHARAQLTAPEGGTFMFGFGAAVALARAHHSRGRASMGVAVLEPLLRPCERSGWLEARAAVALGLGLCMDRDAGREHLHRALGLATDHGLPGVEWEAAAALAEHATGAEAAELRARSAAVVERLATGLDDAGLAAGLLRCIER